MQQEDSLSEAISKPTSTQSAMALTTIELTRDEIIRAFSHPEPVRFIEYLNSANLLDQVISPLSINKLVKQNQYHEENVFEHSLRTLEAAVQLTENPLLRLGALLHDTGKAVTQSIDKNGKIHFFRHEIEGARIVKNWMKLKKFHYEEISYVAKLIRHHQWRFYHNTSDKTIKTFLRQTGKQVWKDLIILRIADRRGNLANQHKPAITAHMQNFINKAEKIIMANNVIFEEDLAITSYDLKELGISPQIIFTKAFPNMIAMTNIHPERNTREYLLKFAEHWIKK